MWKTFGHFISKGREYWSEDLQSISTCFFLTWSRHRLCKSFTFPGPFLISLFSCFSTANSSISVLAFDDASSDSVSLCWLDFKTFCYVYWPNAGTFVHLVASLFSFLYWLCVLSHFSVRWLCVCATTGNFQSVYLIASCDQTSNYGNSNNIDTNRYGTMQIMYREIMCKGYPRKLDSLLVWCYLSEPWPAFGFLLLGCLLSCPDMSNSHREGLTWGVLLNGCCAPHSTRWKTPLCGMHHCHNKWAARSRTRSETGKRFISGYFALIGKGEAETFGSGLPSSDSHVLLAYVVFSGRQCRCSPTVYPAILLLITASGTYGDHYCYNKWAYCNDGSLFGGWKL